MATLPDRAKENPWKLKTPPGTSEYTMHTDEKDGRRILVCTVGNTVLHYDARCIDDLHAMLEKAGDWVELGGADEQKPAKEGTVEAWGRSEANPIGGWYGLKKGLRGRFGVYVPPLMQELGRCELEHNARNKKKQDGRDTPGIQGFWPDHLLQLTAGVRSLPEVCGDDGPRGCAAGSSASTDRCRTMR